MSPVHVAECETAADVRRVLRESGTRRKAWNSPKPPPKSPETPPEEPKTAPVHKGPQAPPRSIPETLAVLGYAIGILDVAQRIADRRDAGYEMELRPLLGAVVRAVASAYGFSSNDLKASRQDAAATQARMVSYLLCKMLTLRSLPIIGEAHGYRDHTTIMSGIRKVERVTAHLPLGGLRQELEAIHTPRDSVDAWAASAARLYPLTASREYKPRPARTYIRRTEAE